MSEIVAEDRAPGSSRRSGEELADEAQPPAKRARTETQEASILEPRTPPRSEASSRKDAWSQTPGAKARANGKAAPTDAVDIRKRLTHIPQDQQVLLELPSGNLKPVKLSPGQTIDLGKFGSFDAGELIGLPYGLTYDIEEVAEDSSNSSRKGKGKSRLKAVLNTTLAELQETDATNEFIRDDGGSQALTYVDIKTLKASGTTGHQLIDLVTASSSSFAQRTVYSQDKFKKRKGEKHLKMFTPLSPSAYNVCRWQFAKNPARIRGLRTDTLGQMMTMANVHAGGRYLIIDETAGMILGAMLERMGADGRVLLINDADSPPPVDIVNAMNLPQGAIDKVFMHIHWAQTEKDWKAAVLPLSLDDLQAGKSINSRDKGKLKRRNAGYQTTEAARKELFEGDFDALIISSEYDSFSIIRRLLPYLAGSASIVVHNPILQPLMETFARMRVMPEFVNTMVTEPWMRKYQVLPGRMHPEMSTSATGGYLLQSLRVLADADRAQEE